MVKMCELCPKLTITLNFSVDGLEEEHNRIRSGGKGGGKLFLPLWKRFMQWKTPRWKRIQNLKLGFITTFTATNQDTVEDLYEYLKAQGPDNVSINLIRGIPKDPLVKNIDISKI